MMTIKQRVIERLDGPRVPFVDADPFRDFCASIRGERSSRGRVAHRILLLGHGARPSRPGVKALIKLGLDHMAAAWCALYSEFTGDRGIVLTDLWPSESEMVKLVEKAPAAAKPVKPEKLQPLPMPEGRKFIGVVKARSGSWISQISIDGKVRQLGRSHDPFVCAQLYDAAARCNPSKTKKRELNFPLETNMKEAA